MWTYYKVIIVLLTLLAANSSAEVIDPLTYCLGQEELMFHKKKETGPYYRLNQAFVNDISSFGGALLKPSHLKDVCKKAKKASFRLLKVLVIEGKGAFAPGAKLNIYQKASLQTLEDKVPGTLVTFLSQMGSLFPHFSCLPTFAPDIPYFLERIKYLEVDLSKSELLSDKTRLKRIFSKLENIESLIKKCEKKLASEKK